MHQKPRSWLKTKSPVISLVLILNQGKKFLVFLLKPTKTLLRTFIFSLLLLSSLHSCKQEEKEHYLPLINPNATERAIKLYQFIQDIQGQYILSGQHNFVGKGSDYSDMLEEITGRKAIV